MHKGAWKWRDLSRTLSSKKMKQRECERVQRWLVATVDSVEREQSVWKVT